jgi:hypothetical protein
VGGQRATSLVRTLYRWRPWLWLVPAVPAAVITALVLVVLPPDQTLDDPAELVFKLSPFVLAVAAVALLPRLRVAPALLLLAVFFYMGYLDTELVLRIQQYGRVAATDGAFQPIYQFELLVTTFVVLFALLAFRLGGARTATVLKTGLAAVLVVISGLNDLTFWALNDVWSAGHRPPTLPWASHMIVFVGGPPSIPVAVTFMVVHLVLAALVASLPLERWVDRRLAVR